MYKNRRTFFRIQRIMRKTFFLIPVVCSICSAHQDAPFSVEYRLLNRVAGVAFQQPAKAEEAVAVLKAILNRNAEAVLGKFVEMSGADPATSALLALRPSEARCRAADKLGELGAIHLSSAEEARSSFQVDKTYGDRDKPVFWCAQAALLTFRDGLVPTIPEKSVRQAR